MHQLKIVVTSFAQSNCYLVMDPETKEGFVVDPGDDAGRIIRGIESMDMKPQAVLMTHGHFDHVLASDGIRAAYGIPAYIGEKDLEMAKDPVKNGGKGYPGGGRGLEEAVGLKDGEVLRLFTPVTVLETPGHSPGGVCYYLKDEGIVFTGDTLFRGTVGRTDLYGGSMEVLVGSIAEKLSVLPEDTQVYPGHGYPSTVGREKAFNPFLNRKW
ncbi:MAG: MBL fold metallo-hydrolase [Lachnospiraceae bacterium]|nr:MBL fold metallo-hydrolase [Lachnospiraceae bacterium]